jgi:hypothetical protein
MLRRLQFIALRFLIAFFVISIVWVILLQVFTGLGYTLYDFQKNRSFQS